MKIYFNPLLNSYNNNRQHQNKHKDNKILSAVYSYNPAVYKDFNISFGARLFRTPENFYEQDFNKEGMPKSLHRYIYNPEHFNFRKTIPPAQAMKEVFGKISDMQTLEDVKEAFPNEPLFADLHSQSSRNARTGVLGELALVRSDDYYSDKSLFKNGKDDLGMYILKKIFIEGKTLKEINKDFQKDKSVVYKGISDIQYADLKAFGIRFPNIKFWKSFIATREDFPYVFIPRNPQDGKTVKHFARINSDAVVKPRPKKRFEDVQDWEINKISDALIEGMGNKKETEKLLKKRSIKNTESLNFVAKYMSEINSIVLEKLHVSEEMKMFFDNYENLSKSQKQKFKDYWDSPATRELRSMVMSSTIRFFFDIYGVDGKNDEFVELLEYAHGIKARRIAQQEEHDRIQAEYDKMFHELDLQENKPEQKVEDTPQVTHFEDYLQNEANKVNGKLYDFMVDDGVKVSLCLNIPKIITSKYEHEYRFLPKNYAKNFTDFVLNYPKVNDYYLLSLLCNDDNMLEKGDYVSNKVLSDEPIENISLNSKYVDMVKKMLMPEEKIKAIKDEIYESYMVSNKKLESIAIQTLSELITKLINDAEDSNQNDVLPELKNFISKLDSNEDINIRPFVLNENMLEVFKKEAIKSFKLLKKHNIAFLNTTQLCKILDVAGYEKLPDKDVDFVNKTMKKYQPPLSEKEIRKISYKIVDNLINYNAENSSVLDEPHLCLFNAVQKNITKYSNIRSGFIKVIQRAYVLPENTTLRYLIDENADKKLTEALTERFIINLIINSKEIFYFLASIDLENLDKYVKPYSSDMYSKMLDFRYVSSKYFDSFGV